MKKKQQIRIKNFVKYLFKESKEVVSINITVTKKKRKNRYLKNTIGSRASGLSFRRQDFIDKEEKNE